MSGKMSVLYDVFCLLYYALALLFGSSNLIYLTLGAIVYKNRYLRYLWLSYAATTIMLAIYAVQFFLIQFALIHVQFSDYIVPVCMSLVIFSNSRLLQGLLYEGGRKWTGYAIYAVTAAPLLCVAASLVLPGSVSAVFNKAAFLVFFLHLGFICILFFLGMKRLDQSYKKFSVPFLIILSAFALLFLLLAATNSIINPLPLFYMAWSVVFIHYFWKNIFRAKFDNLDPAPLIERFSITEREREVIDLILQGKSNKEIGASLFISDRTVRNHIYNIYKKLGINSRFELMGLFRGNRYKPGA